ncbi:MAG: TonB-dependent siderophore receptor [Rhodanobacter denitrificans]|uniref:TonB-dependent siderophore receptor n=1 Tax=Rhodanobacter denitrificans TaxID=666685 RepID=A0A2W5KWC8_9GAMM|nr:MAG: TonB-dependent siderophore receptor [Rhodanobacter denitrificans]
MRRHPYIRSSSHAPKRFLTTAIGVAFASTAVGALAAAESQAAPEGDADASSAEQLDTVNVHGEPLKKPSSSKYTELLRDTPQSITVVPQKIIAEQNLLTLRDILSTLPGITFGAGEGGGGYGDSINLRGFTGGNDITVDGVRDSAQYTRSDPFNLEAVELVNGANSAYAGAGSVGGSINLVSKAAREGDFTTISGGLGSDSYRRLTLDTNQQFGESTAFRLNLMGHHNDVPGRDYEKFERWGFAPSVAFGLGTDTRVTLSYVHQKDDNLPQYGVPYYNGGPLPGVDSSNFYGYRNVDKQDITLDAFTAIIDHHFNDGLSLRNLSRVQQVDQKTIVDAVQGTWCMPNNLTPTGAPCTSGTGASQIVVPIGSYLPSGPRGYVRDTTNDTLYNQTDFTFDFTTGPVSHTLVTGVSLLHEKFDLDTGSVFRNADGSNPFTAPEHLPFMDIYDPDSYYTGPYNYFRTGKTRGELDNRAIYAFDTIKFNEQWQLSLGARYERNEGSSTAYTVSTAAGSVGQITGAAAPVDNDDNLFSFRGGLVYKPVENGTVYLAYSNSKTPSKASVNGSCTASSTTGTANCNVDPETAVNYELGTKWDFLDGALSLTGSVFRNDRKNYRVNDPDPLNPTGEQALDGEARVDGILLGVSGKITDAWSIYANYARLDSEVLQGVSDFAAGQGEDWTRGDRLTQTPENSLSLWTTYQIADWQFGYGATYQGKIWLTQHSATNPDGPLVTAPDYWVHRAMVAWRVNRNLNLQFNVNNLTDKEYYTRIRNNGWATPGEGRSYVVTATYGF